MGQYTIEIGETLQLKSMMIINPASAGGSTGKRVKHLEEAIRVKFPQAQVMLTTGKGSATACVLHALQNGFDHIIAAGGDGTFNEIINGMFDQGKPINPRAVLTLIPTGTGGDFKRSLGLSNMLEETITRLNNARYQKVDIGLIQFKDESGKDLTRHFLNVASLGITTKVAKGVNSSNWTKFTGGPFTYLFHALINMYKYNPIEVEIAHDEAASSVRMVTALAIANGKYFGGGMKIAPQAELKDHKFQMVLLENFSKFDMYSKNLMLYWGGHTSLKKCHISEVSTVTLNSATQVEIEADGELIGFLPAKIQCIPSALTLLN